MAPGLKFADSAVDWGNLGAGSTLVRKQQWDLRPCSIICKNRGEAEGTSRPSSYSKVRWFWLRVVRGWTFVYYHLPNTIHTVSFFEGDIIIPIVLMRRQASKGPSSLLPKIKRCESGETRIQIHCCLLSSLKLSVLCIFNLTFPRSKRNFFIVVKYI